MKWPISNQNDVGNEPNVLAGAACDFDSKHEGDIAVLHIGLL